ncbi:MAG: hypothetical protein JKY52_18240 [Flavobacteriales bacterium]|nr:hypothetical protein [Flavobacteriales bacterium]
MRRLFALMLVACLFALGTNNNINAAEGVPDTVKTESLSDGQITTWLIYPDGDTVDLAEVEAAADEATAHAEKKEAKKVEDEVLAPEELSFHQVVKQKFIEGGAEFMGIVLFCLIMGLALCIEP